MMSFVPFPVGCSPVSTASGVDVRKSSAFHRKYSVRSSNDLAARIVDFLRSRHPRKPAEAVAAETGIAAATVSKWIEGGVVPGGVAMLRLTGAYGPEFLHAVMASPPAWLDAAARDAAQARLRAQIAALQRRLEAT